MAKRGRCSNLAAAAGISLLAVTAFAPSLAETQYLAPPRRRLPIQLVSTLTPLKFFHGRWSCEGEFPRTYRFG